MAKAMMGTMNYYEKLVHAMECSMAANPHAAMVMDMTNFEIVAKGSFKSLGKKIAESKLRTPRVVFQKPDEKAIRIL